MTLLEKMSRAMEPDLWKAIDQKNGGWKVFRDAAIERAREGLKAVRKHCGGVAWDQIDLAIDEQ